MLRFPKPYMECSASIKFNTTGYVNHLDKRVSSRKAELPKELKTAITYSFKIIVV